MSVNIVSTTLDAKVYGAYFVDMKPAAIPPPPPKVEHREAVVSFRPDRETLAALNAYEKKHDVTRGAAVLHLVRFGLGLPVTK